MSLLVKASLQTQAFVTAIYVPFMRHRRRQPRDNGKDSMAIRLPTSASRLGLWPPSGLIRTSTSWSHVDFAYSTAGSAISSSKAVICGTEHFPSRYLVAIRCCHLGRPLMGDATSMARPSFTWCTQIGLSRWQGQDSSRRTIARK